MSAPKTGSLAALVFAWLWVWLSAWSPAAIAQVVVTGPEGDCGFAKLAPRRILQYVEKGALSKVKPPYPPVALAKGLTGSVRVRVLIDNKGLVERTCPEYEKDKPRPDRSLVIAAEAAALQWTFDPNFSAQNGSGVRFEHAQGVLIFDFVLDEPNRPSKQ